jgi:hypothetical protein
MLHKVSDLTKKVSVMYDKSLLLHRLKYDTPAHLRDDLTIQVLIDDIRQLAGDIYNDRAPYARSIDDEFETAAS